MEVEMQTMELLDSEIHVLNPEIDADFSSCTLNPSPATVTDDQTTPSETAFDGVNGEVRMEIEEICVESNGKTINMLNQLKKQKKERKLKLKLENLSLNAEEKKQREEKQLKLKLEIRRQNAEEKEMKKQFALKEESERRAAKLKQFQHLLSKSQFYTKFLSKRIEDQIKEKRVKERKSEQHKHRRSHHHHARPEKENNSESHTRREKPAKRKALQLCDYINDDEIRETLAETASPTKETETEPEFSAEETFSTNSNGLLVSNRQPSWLTGGVLKNYQLDGYEWLRALYQNGLNGILADEMGLGKTIQCIALICHLIEQNVSGPHLIVAPMSTLDNWVSEFSRFAPDIPTCLYHGTKEKRSFLRRRIQFRVCSRDKNLFPVVISNYEAVLRDAKELSRLSWRFIIIDEGHRIKNFDCLLIKALKTFNSKNRLLMTGTPLQNNLSELWSLLNYILPEMFDNLQVFESLFDVKTMNNDESYERIAEEEQKNHIVSTIHEILSPFLLRRLKCDVELNLPSKKELLVYAPLTAIQQEYYSQSVNKTLWDFLQPEKFQPLPEKRRRKALHPEGYLASFLDDDVDLEDVMEQHEIYCREQEELMEKLRAETPNPSCRNNLKQQDIMQLRKCCNHPYLISQPLQQNGDMLVDERLVQSAGKLLVLDAMLPKLKERGHKVLLFSQMTQLLDLLQDYCNLRGHNYRILNGSMKLDARKENISDFNNDPEVFLFLLSTRAGGLGLNLTAADTVFIYDSDWNPQCDLQAVDRCHRIGQSKPVVIYRLITVNTIDQKIVERAASKRKLEKIVMHKDKFKCRGNNERKYFTKSEMLELLKSRDHERIVQTAAGEKVFTDDEMEALLDRSKMAATNARPDVKCTDHVFKVMDDDSNEGNFHFLADNES